MITRTLLLVTGLAASVLSGHTPFAPHVRSITVDLGGPPAIRIAGKASGDITAAQWSTVKAVELVGCVPGARIVDLHICIKDCSGKDAGLRTKNAVPSEAMRSMVKNLPVGTPFTVSVKVNDERGKAWDVPSAKYMWRG